MRAKKRDDAGNYHSGDGDRGIVVHKHLVTVGTRGNHGFDQFLFLCSAHNCGCPIGDINAHSK